MKLLNTILNFIFPVNCISCSKKGVDLCLDCIIKSPTAERETTNWIFPLYDYRHIPTKKAIWLLKYKGKRRLAEIFAEALHGKIAEELADLTIFENFREPILIPIPLSKKRMHERGFNQAELICKKLVDLDTEKNLTLVTNVLIKTKETEHQAKIRDRNIRLKNLCNSFEIKNSEKIKNRNIILIDDVTTTGATFNEAKKVLKQKGAKKIIAFAIAH
ncbi:MAG: phosphoribosyltransferase family protein [Candidatus Nomurabacteria bacterium]|nr:phosphoribosyltransferase family protein [Candidatus Nomurabacteria bacterium]